MIVPSADIEATYENVHATCPLCAHQNVYNRRSDLNNLRPIDNARVKCENCSDQFDIVGDLINPAHEMLLLDCRPLFDRKHYMQCVLGIAQAYEVFFDHFLHVQLVYRPLGTGGDLDFANQLREKLYAKVERFTFEPMRRLFLGMVLGGVAPATLADSEALIDAFPERGGNIRAVSRDELAAVTNEGQRELLLGLHQTTINQLRNQVIHKDAYRPTRDEAWAAYEEASRILFGLTSELRLRGNANYYINGGDRWEPPAVPLPPGV
ncbi:MAG: hypothetical protein HYZ29_04800 [Myxococcales bacterium]|nr:hypothetical protein [Myxococcales bacterium]